MIEPPPYPPIGHYGPIGNLRTVALVNVHGSVDWCCFPNLESPSVFGALLDRYRGGRFSIAPSKGSPSGQHYFPETNVLETIFGTDGGRLVLTDWMPLAGNIDGCGKSRTEPALFRLLRCEGSATEVTLTWSPRHNYGRGKTNIRRTAGGFLAEGDNGQRLVLPETFPNGLITDDGYGPAVYARFLMTPGQSLLIATRWDATDAWLDTSAALDTLEVTTAVWRDWVAKDEAHAVRQWAAVEDGLIVRSELVLRLLMHGDTGGIAAAATTSLPEDVGGIRNWDYRFAWVRDSSQLIESFMDLGHHAEVVDFVHFIERVSEHRKNGEAIRIMYGLHGEIDCLEEILDRWEGYRQSTPVRIGNAGFRQKQHDVYGEILNSAYEMARFGQKLRPSIRKFLAHLADQACDNWRQPDQGIWEIPGSKRHYVYTKMMSWVALDRAVLLAEKHGLAGDVNRWRRERDKVHQQILREGYSSEAGAFTQSYGSPEIDAANLLLPMMEFLPFDDPRIQSTINRTIERLTHNGLVYRYLADDGLPGQEGTFGLMSFWLVDVLALSGRLDEAHQYLEAILKHANHLGLFSEQIDPRSGELLGNFPQAFTHLGLIDSSLHLAYVEKGDAPIEPPIGSAEHRREAGRAETVRIV